MRKEMIAPCGMNCELCIAHLGMKNDINKKHSRITTFSPFIINQKEVFVKRGMDFFRIHH